MQVRTPPAGRQLTAEGEVTEYIYSSTSLHSLPPLILPSDSDSDSYLSYKLLYRLQITSASSPDVLIFYLCLFLSPGMFQSCQTSFSKCCKSNIIIIIIITIITIVICYCRTVLAELNLFISSDKWFEFNDNESILPQISTWNICCSKTTN